MPVRDWEAFSGTKPTGFNVFVNRGANGIDGLVAASCGMARGRQANQNILIIGDVALSHDVGSLALVAQSKNPLTLIVINNGGGRIFQHLPIAGVEMDFESFYLTPPQADLAKLAAAYHIDFTEARDPAHFRETLATIPERSRILSVTTDPDSDLAARKSFISDLIQTL